MTETVEIRKAEVTINTLRIGTKQVTKQVWRQIPYMNLDYFLSNQIPVLGYVVGDTDAYGCSSPKFLVVNGTTPYKIGCPDCPYAPILPNEQHWWTEQQKIDAALEYKEQLAEYKVNEGIYNAFKLRVKDATQLYIGA